MEKLKKILCIFIGHSRIHKCFMGYHHCARCGELVGDALGGVVDARDLVVFEHNCQTCFDNYAKLGWRDKLLTPYPFEKDENGVVRVITKEERDRQFQDWMAKMEADRARRAKRRAEMETIWEDLPEDVLAWVQSVKKESDKEDAESGIMRLLNDASAADEPMKDFFKRKYEEDILIKSGKYMAIIS